MAGSYTKQEFVAFSLAASERDRDGVPAVRGCEGACFAELGDGYSLCISGEIARERVSRSTYAQESQQRQLRHHTLPTSLVPLGHCICAGT